MSDVALLEDIASLAPNEIQLTVLADMRLVISPQEIARAGEHNSAYFNIVQQPVSLDGLPCRAEIKCADGTTFYVLVTDGAFLLTNDITIHGTGNLQLVYADGAVSHKTQIAQYYVAQSIYAVDPSSPDYVDGLAQLTLAAFANVTYDQAGSLLAFYNVAMQPRGSVTISGGGAGGGLDETQANLLYLRRDSANAMDASVLVRGPNRGVSFDFEASASAVYSDGTLLILRRPAGNAEVVIENNNGATGSRSAIVTQASGDVRYLTQTGADLRYLLRTGGQMTGPLVTAGGSGLANMGLAIGDNATGFYRAGNVLVIGVSGSMVAQLFVDSWMMTVALNMALQRIYNLADATADTDALNRRTGDVRYLQPATADARFLQLAGGTMAGTLTTKPGTGANDLGIAIGDGGTGFYRAGAATGADLMVMAAGYPMLVLTGTREAVIAGPLSLSMNRIFNLADPGLPNDAATKGYVDSQQIARSLLMEAPGDVGPIGTPTFQNFMPVNYSIPRGGNSRIMVSAILDCATGGEAQIVIAGVRIDVYPTVVRRAFLYAVGGQCAGICVQFVLDVAGTSIGPFNVQVANVGNQNNYTVLAGSQVVVQDLGPR
jgi:hypothetical protein